MVECYRCPLSLCPFHNIRTADIPNNLVPRPRSRPPPRCHKLDLQRPLRPAVLTQRSPDNRLGPGQHANRCLPRSNPRMCIHHPRSVPARYAARQSSVPSPRRHQSYPRRSRVNPLRKACHLHRIDRMPPSLRAPASPASRQSSHHVWPR